MSSFPKNISITVLTGFLGSGKTTILTSLIKQKQICEVSVFRENFEFEVRNEEWCVVISVCAQSCAG